MTVYQSNSNALVAFKVQSALGTASSGAGAAVIPMSGGMVGNQLVAMGDSPEQLVGSLSASGCF